MSDVILDSKVWQNIKAVIESKRLAHALMIAGNNTEKNDELANLIIQALLNTTTVHSHPDVLRVFPDNKIITVNSIRSLVEWVSTSSHAGHGKVVVIHPAQAMNKAAMNALLKTLEEPPENVNFILLCEKPSLLLPTIKSRCQWVRGFDEENDACLQELSWKKTLEALLMLRMSPIEFAKFCIQEKLELSEVLLVLQWVFVDCIRVQSGLESKHFNVVKVAQKAHLKIWYKLLDKVSYYQGLSMNKFNLNTELVLDDIAIDVSESLSAVN